MKYEFSLATVVKQQAGLCSEERLTDVLLAIRPLQMRSLLAFLEVVDRVLRGAGN
jgi:hypothetical protein